MMQKPFRSLLGSAAVSLAVILTVLAITCFAVLTFLSANNEYQLSRKSAETVTRYYQADAIAAERLSKISHAVKTGNVKDFNCKKDYNITTYSTGCRVSFQIPAGSAKELRVTADVFSSGQVRILEWKTAATTQGE